MKLGGPSGKFFFEGSGNKVGAAYFVSLLAADLSTVRFARYSANFIPRNAPVLTVVDDINNNVGFWAPQPDFRIPERLSPGFGTFPDLELEAMYHDQVGTWTAYQIQGLLGLHSTGPAANIYANLQGRESGGTVTPADYPALVTQVAAVLRAAIDPNAFYNPGAA